MDNTEELIKQFKELSEKIDAIVDSADVIEDKYKVTLSLVVSVYSNINHSLKKAMLLEDIDNEELQKVIIDVTKDELQEYIDEDDLGLLVVKIEKY